MRLPVRLLAVCALVAGLLGFGEIGAFVARAAPTPAPDDDAACGCGVGIGACQHFLRNPAGPTDDPCWCDRCETGLQGRRHDGTTVPPGWNPDCFRSERLACYLKRHAGAWGISCSECMAADACCPFKDKANCPDCDTPTDGFPFEKDFLGRDARKTVAARLAKESKFFRKPEDVVVAYDRHFYVVTDIEGLKVRTPNGVPRPITKHEWVHLMIERAEWCRREWVRALGETRLGPPKQTGKPQEPESPMALFLCAKERDKQAVASAYFAAPLATFLLGNAGKVADDMCVTGMCFSKERYGGDHDLQLEMRHQLAHNLFSCFGWHETRPKSFPQWAFEGLAHWMEKRTSTFADDATYCVREGAGPGGERKGGGKDWDEEVAKLAVSPKLDPIEALLGKTVKGELTPDDHMRSWSLVTLGLSDFGKSFVELLADLRKERDLREAFVARLGMTPEELDLRWRDRVTGKRTSLAGDAARVAGAGAPGGGTGAATPAARERDSIRAEQDPVTLAAKVRAQGAIGDPEMADVVLDTLARKNDLVRETSLVTLLKLKDAACRKRVVAYGLAHSDPIVRAYSARVCGRLELRDAIPRLVEVLADANWYARAEAAVALGRMKHIDAMAALRKMVTSDASEKVQVAAMDALASYGGDAQMAVPLIARHLESAQWQLRVAACQALGAIGSMEAVEPLITRMEQETGRVGDEIRAALRAIARDDLGAKAENWRAWWAQEKAKHPGAVPPRPGEAATTGKKEPPKPDDYGPAPQYYGIEIRSSRIGFVVDTSKSMALLFVPDPKGAKVLSREYLGRDKLSICREEVAQTLRSLDRSAHFLIVTFGTAIRSFKPNPVPASPANVDAGLDFLGTIPAAGETNYYDSLKAALDLGDEPDTNANFRRTPDTITFLTDGEPTAGAVTDGDVLVEWYTGLNRYARVKTHTITFGLNRVDQPLLRRLAEQNGGRFIVVPEKQP